VDGRALVADVDDADALSIEPHPVWHDMTAAQRKHARNAASLQEARDEVGGTVRRDFHLGDSIDVRVGSHLCKPGDEQ
jgi:hypothetical protein